MEDQEVIKDGEANKAGTQEDNKVDGVAKAMMGGEDNITVDGEDKVDGDMIIQ